MVKTFLLVSPQPLPYVTIFSENSPTTICLGVESSGLHISSLVKCHFQHKNTFCFSFIFLKMLSFDWRYMVNATRVKTIAYPLKESWWKSYELNHVKFVNWKDIMLLLTIRPMELIRWLASVFKVCWVRSSRWGTYTYTEYWICLWNRVKRLQLCSLKSLIL